MFNIKCSVLSFVACTWLRGTCYFTGELSKKNVTLLMAFEVQVSQIDVYEVVVTDLCVHCIQKKETKLFFCNISYKNWAILMKFGVYGEY